ncbi:hypothetical protein ZWY2020_014457 [Hordeum vulgare]|nr:hypothetical protein ZWY2020_014457 [Hordeum vulgare]
MTKIPLLSSSSSTRYSLLSFLLLSPSPAVGFPRFSQIPTPPPSQLPPANTPPRPPTTEARQFSPIVAVSRPPPLHSTGVAPRSIRGQTGCCRRLQ